MTAEVTYQGGFNTGRLYTANGQRVYWWQLDDGWLYFRDTSRMVDGFINRGAVDEHFAHSLPSSRWIMVEYDHGRHERCHPDRDVTLHYAYEVRVPEGFDFGPLLRI